MRIFDLVRDLGKPLCDPLILEREYKGLSVDSRKIVGGEIFVAIKGKNHDGHDYIKEAIQKGAVIAVSEVNIEGVPLILVGDSLSALWEIAARYIRYRNPFVIGVTGTCGKTTVKEMLAKALSSFGRVAKTKGNENNLIGLPLNASNIGDVEFFVAEMGTNSEGEISILSKIVGPTVGVITAVDKGHLEGLRDVYGVFREKISILDGLKEGGILVFPGDSPFRDHAVKYAVEKKVKPVLFYGKDVCELEPGLFRVNVSGKVYMDRFRFCGSHMGLDLLIALKVIEAIGLDVDVAWNSLREFEPLKGRFNILRLKDITIVDDTYNANPLSTKQALSSLSKFNGRKIFVFGTMMELGDESGKLHEEVGRFAWESGFTFMFVIGENTEYALSEFVKMGGEGMAFRTHEEVVSILSSFLKSGDVVLVKGSRSMKMERIVEGLIECFGS